MRFIIVLFILFSNIAFAQIFNEKTVETDTTKKPFLDFSPKELKVVNDTSQFYSAEIKILNRGDGVLKIQKIIASCYCSNGYVLENDIEPLSTGVIQLNINKKGLEEGQDSVVFTVYSNATNSPTFYTVKFINEDVKEEKKE